MNAGKLEWDNNQLEEKTKEKERLLEVKNEVQKTVMKKMVFVYIKSEENNKTDMSFSYIPNCVKSWKSGSR